MHTGGLRRYSANLETPILGLVLLEQEKLVDLPNKKPGSFWKKLLCQSPT